MKKLIAITLCIATILTGAVLTTYAEESGNTEVTQAPYGTVIGAKTFDYSDSIEKIKNIATNGSLSINNNGYLKTAAQSSGWHRVVIAEKAEMPEDGNYSVSVTFRWTGHDSSSNCAVYFGTYGCDFSVKYNGTVQNFNTASETPGWNNNLGKSVRSLWVNELEPDANGNPQYEPKASNPFVTATLNIKGFKPDTLVFEADGKEIVLTYTGNVTDVKTQSKSAGKYPSGDHYEGAYTGGNMGYHEISKYSVKAADGSLIASESFAGESDMHGLTVTASAAPALSNAGYLVPGLSNWHKIEMLTDAQMSGVDTYSIQQTFRWTDPQEGNDIIYFGAYFCDFTLNYNGSIQYFSASNGNVTVPTSVSSKWKVSADKPVSEWVTATLVIVENKPVKMIIEVDGEYCEIPYAAGKIESVKTHNKQGTAQSANAVAECGIYSGGNSKAMEIYDFRVIAGAVERGGNVPTKRVPDGNSVIEFYGAQKALDGSSVRIIAKLHDTSVSGVNFEFTCSKTSGKTVTKGKHIVTNPVRYGYSYINEQTSEGLNAVYAGDDALFVLFVIDGISFEDVDSYELNVRVLADAYCSDVQTVVIPK